MTTRAASTHALLLAVLIVGASCVNPAAPETPTAVFDDPDVAFVPAPGDWSYTPYTELAIVTGSAVVEIGSEYAGHQLQYIVTNATASTLSIVPPSLSGSAVLSGALATSALVDGSSSSGAGTRLVTSGGFGSLGVPRARPRAIQGFPGQHDLPAAIERSDTVVLPSAVRVASVPVVGETATFRADVSAGSGDSDVTAVATVARTVGEWSLVVWVDEDDWHGSTLLGAVTQEMVDAVADRFLIEGPGNDIFDWVTTVYGMPWGNHDATNLIDASDRTIHVLFVDIDGDTTVGTDGGFTVGYFFSRDNYTTAQQPDSNERVMFYMDSVLLSRRDSTAEPWTADDYWPEHVISTLAHEFQHMVHFYQRSVRLGADARYDSWLNEMLSMVAEDLVADKLGINGPRGVPPTSGVAPTGGYYGARKPDDADLYYLVGDRIAHANYYAGVTPLTTWVHDDVAQTFDDYGISYAFGAWLSRQYGAALIQHLLVESPAPQVGDTLATYGQDRIVAAIAAESDESVTFAELLRRWGVALVTADATMAPRGYRLNTASESGWFVSTVSGVEYHLGSINPYAHIYYNSDDDEWHYGPAFYPPVETGASVAATSSLNVIDTRLPAQDGILGRVPSDGVTLTFEDVPAGLTVTVLLWNPEG